MFPRVSIIVITKDRREVLGKCLESLLELEYLKERLEIVVVEEGDKPDPVDGVKYIHIPRENKGWGYARNTGIKNASHDLIAFTDDDCIVAKNWLAVLVESLSDDVGGVTGGVLVKDCNAIGYCENVLGFPNGGLIRIHGSGGSVQDTEFLSTCNCLYRREVFNQVGDFYDEQNTRGTDRELAARATKIFKCKFVPGAVVYHKPKGSLFGIFRWFVERGRSQVMIVPHISGKKRNVLVRVKNSLGTRVFVLAFILYLAWPLRWILLSGLAGLYYLLNMYRYSFCLKYFKRYDVLLYSFGKTCDGCGDGSRHDQ